MVNISAFSALDTWLAGTPALVKLTKLTGTETISPRLIGTVSDHLAHPSMRLPAAKDAFDHLWELITGAIALQGDTFQILQNQPHSLIVALSIVFIAGLAQSLSQIVVLFVNQVRPLRFVLSLVISALFFVIGYGFWVLSIWAIINTFLESYLPFLDVIKTLGFSYAPLMLGLLVVIPYFGSTIFVILSIWALLAVVVGLESITTLGLWEAFASAALGWVMLQLLQKTVGQPIASLGQWITNWAAGEQLITNRVRLAEELYTGLRSGRGLPVELSGVIKEKEGLSSSLHPPK